MSYKLILGKKGGDSKGYQRVQEYGLDSELTIGRLDENDITFRDRAVSRKHGRFYTRQGTRKKRLWYTAWIKTIEVPGGKSVHYVNLSRAGSYYQEPGTKGRKMKQNEDTEMNIGGWIIFHSDDGFYRLRLAEGPVQLVPKSAKPAKPALASRSPEAIDQEVLDALEGGDSVDLDDDPEIAKAIAENPDLSENMPLSDSGSGSGILDAAEDEPEEVKAMRAMGTDIKNYRVSKNGSVTINPAQEGSASEPGDYNKKPKKKD